MTYNQFSPPAYKGYKTKGVSKTVPGQSMSITKVVERFQRGQSVEMFRSGGYDESVPPGLERLDKIERIEYARENAKRIQKIREHLARPKQEQPPEKVESTEGS